MAGVVIAEPERQPLTETPASSVPLRMRDLALSNAAPRSERCVGSRRHAADGVAKRDPDDRDKGAVNMNVSKRKLLAGGGRIPAHLANGADRARHPVAGDMAVPAAPGVTTKVGTSPLSESAAEREWRSPANGIVGKTVTDNNRRGDCDRALPKAASQVINALHSLHIFRFVRRVIGATRIEMRS